MYHVACNLAISRHEKKYLGVQKAPGGGKKAIKGCQKLSTFVFKVERFQLFKGLESPIGDANCKMIGNIKLCQMNQGFKALSRPEKSYGHLKVLTPPRLVTLDDFFF